MKKLTTRQMATAAMLTAAVAVLSQLAIPLPIGVPISLQTFAVALCGYILGRKIGTICIAVYISLGAAGLPVFANFGGGVGKIVGVTGGFIFGFLFLAFFCGAALKTKSKVTAILFGMIGLLFCHLLGVLQFSFVSSRTLWEAFLTVSLPFLLKDIVSIIAAYYIAQTLRKRNIV